jgi:hypothetical protein
MSHRRRFLRILSMRCDESVELMSQGADEPLALLDRLALRSHLLLCGPCRRFCQQLRFLRVAVRRMLSRAEDSGATLSADARARILIALRNESSE